MRNLFIFIFLFTTLRGADLTDLTWEIENGEVTIIRCDRRAQGTLVVPAEIEGLPVTAIEEWAFINFELTRISLPTSLRTIGAFAFYASFDLTSIQVAPDNEHFQDQNGILFSKSLETPVAYPKKRVSPNFFLPDCVTTIREGALVECPHLHRIEVGPDNQTYQSLEGVLFNEEMTSIIAYPSGSPLKNYYLPESVTSIENEAFPRCENLISLTLPQSLTSIGAGAIENCRNLSMISLPNQLSTR